eukprot:TRINITY_DN10441_c0_g1_i1.p1 TRINITY_DN10441_c0_g1~~TRINITY_DN10441_c0_g1_i1.p1  ORF type:complete len:208 (-),score=24.18 TRINITY_DN10441_c0_g1_i1:31-618(-)
MGQFFSSITSNLRSFFSGTKQTKLLLFGLDAAGKTTILYKLGLGNNIEHHIPTIGINIEIAEIPNTNTRFISLDLGGRMGWRFLERVIGGYLESNKADGLIYVVDSGDRERVETAKEYLERTLDGDGLIGLEMPVLVFANKQDLSGAMSVEEIRKVFEGVLESPRSCCVVGSSALSGDGLEEGLKWMSEMLKKRE